MIKFKKYNTAFTLAEVLITLAVIGVIATITIPALTQNIQDQQYKIAWKKAYGNLEQVSRRVLMNNAGSFKGICDDGDDQCLKNLFLPYLNYIKSCNSVTVYGNCWHKSLYDFTYMDGTPATDWNITSSIILNNGVFIMFSNSSKTCSSPSWNIYRCGRMTIDINGFKGPNKFGYDIFAINVLEKKLAPYGYQNDAVKNMCKNSTGAHSGLECATKYLYQ
jgi:prepilin-type N-terminal cleavage/methylation domain-containing protein